VNETEGWRAVMSRTTGSAAVAPLAFCIQCGAALPPGAQFCATCGTRVSGDVAQPVERTRSRGLTARGLRPAGRYAPTLWTALDERRTPAPARRPADGLRYH
jgi:predicted nucleic acid-binding Zn ribbon protein